MLTGDRLIRVATAAVVAGVAVIAAAVSYSHIYLLGRAHGQDGWAAHLLPLSVDGLILAASLVLLHSARDGDETPALARWMLWLGVAATLAANAAYGAPYGPLGVLVSAWPAVAFVGCAELLMGMIRRAHRPLVAETRPGVADVRPPVATDAITAARLALEASIAAGEPVSQRHLARQFGITRHQAKQLAADVAA